jgi:hypothetical protein
LPSERSSLLRPPTHNWEDLPHNHPHSTLFPQPLLSLHRYELDLIFSKAKRPGRRKLYFDDYLQALLELAVVLYPDEDPTTAMTLLLVKHILALFDQQPATQGDVFETVQKELLAF